MQTTQSSNQNITQSVKEHAERSTTAPILLALICATVWGLIIAADTVGFSRASYDAHMFHLPTVRVIAEHAPDVPWNSLRTATTPGYHIALAAASFATPDLAALRAWGMVFSALAVLTVGLVIGRSMNSFRTLCCVLPFATCVYLSESAVHIIPDGAAWLWVAATLGVLFFWTTSKISLFILAAVLALTVFTRQIHFWLAGVIIFTVWLDAAQGSLKPTWLTEHPRKRALAALKSTPTVFPACIILAVCIATWGGLLPEVFRTQLYDPMRDQPAVKNTGINFATPAATLVVFGLYAIFYLPTCINAFKSLWPRGQRLQLIAIVVVWLTIGIFLAITSPTTYSTDSGRYGGFWALGKLGPAIADRSLAITLLAGFGGVMLGLILAMLDRRSRWILGISVLGYWASHIVAAFAWQRYIEPLVLILLTYAACLIHKRFSSPAISWLAPALLGLAFIALSATRLQELTDWKTYDWPDKEAAMFYQTESFRHEQRAGQVDAILELDAPSPTAHPE